MQKLLIAGLSAWMLLTGAVPSPASPLDTDAPAAQPAIPYVPTRHDAVRDLLWLADVGTNDVVYDLGSGDGRVVVAAVRDFHARKGIGIEIDPQLVRASREKAVQAGVADRGEFIQGDLFTNDFSEASVVVLYLGHAANLDLRARLVQTLKPGARIVSHKFGMGEWPADKELDVRTAYLGMQSEMRNPFTDNPDVPDFGSNGRYFGHDFLSVWIVPAPVAGVWRGNVRTGGEERELKLILHQRLSGVTGSFQFLGPTNWDGFVQADLWGEHFRCGFWATNASNYGFQMIFDGHVHGDTMKGTLEVFERNQVRELQWEGHRDKADLTGTWEWTGPMGSPVQLKIERHNGRLVATYIDKNRTWPDYLGGNKPIPVTDFYDFGGGCYFALLLGLQGSRLTGSSRRAGPEDGWLVGEGVMTNNTIGGTVAFYPYSESDMGFPQAGRGAAAQQGRRDWSPKRLTE
jgi:hypothetical protein